VSVWNGNPGPDDYRAWSGPEQSGTDVRLADHFAADRGLTPTGERGRPPVLVATAELTPTARVTGVADGAPDVFTLGPTRPYGESFVAETLPDSEAERLTTAPVARGGQAFFLSPAVAEAGVTALTADEIRRIYRGETDNWRAVGGPDRDIHVVGGATSTPNSRMKETFLRLQLAVDVRFGQPRNRLEVTLDRDDAITYLPVGSARSSLPVVDVVVDGTTHGVTDPGYPTTVTHAAHAWDEFDAREGAFVDMLRSPVGQAIVAAESRLLPVSVS
jgi:phosphate transport system substrate-binding protein